ncbi:MAG: FAD binding domain-containing protein [Pseudomonadota bacterium]|nr:FAD binding domain-containing protein [Pseudomonadota bacterium]MEC8127956.1 FAD binding domain-containing protein [Pseudomonadota bacterium]MEC8672429.1 FAD binding domain-containing protein [Pseudomonadota bacterium]
MSYLRPHRLEDALEWLAAERPLVMAGCTDIYPLHQTPALDGPLLDITGLDELRGITAAEGWRRIGAATSWADIIRAGLPPAYDGLIAAAREIGGVQIQASGTIGGNLCTASPAGDSIPCLMTLDAEIELASQRGRRRLPLADFLTGARQTARDGDELVIAIHVPEQAEAGRAGFEKLGARRYLVISIAMAAARLVVSGGRIASAAIAVGACAPVAVRLGEIEAALHGLACSEAEPWLRDNMAGIMAALSPIDDVRGTAGYRREAAAELVTRLVGRLCGDTP